jgi:hypothetical protein
MWVQPAGNKFMSRYPQFNQWNLSVLNLDSKRNQLYQGYISQLPSVNVLIDLKATYHVPIFNGDLIVVSNYTLPCIRNITYADLSFYINFIDYTGNFRGNTMLQIGMSRVRFPMRSLDCFFNWSNPSRRTMTTGSTQPLTQMSTTNLLG